MIVHYVLSGNRQLESNEKQHLVWAENTNSVAARPQDVDVQPILLLDWVVEKRTLFLKNQFVQGDLQPVMGLWPV